MKRIAILAGGLLICSSATVFAQQERADYRNNPTDTARETLDHIENRNNPTFRDDSTDATMGLSPLGGTPGRSTTSGAGGLGTISHPGHNTSSDIYNMERRDSIRRAKLREQDSLQRQETAK